MRAVVRSVSSLTILAMVASVSAKADCDFSKGIEKLPDGRYAYTADCNRKVGKLQMDADDRKEQIDAKDVQLKDLGVQLDAQQKSRQIWMDTSTKLEDRVSQMEEMKSHNQWLFFGLGVVVTGAAVWGAGQLRR